MASHFHIPMGEHGCAQMLHCKFDRRPAQEFLHRSPCRKSYNQAHTWKLSGLSTARYLGRFTMNLHRMATISSVGTSTTRSKRTATKLFDAAVLCSMQLAFVCKYSAIWYTEDHTEDRKAFNIMS